MEEQCSLSLRLYEVLENVGASEEMRELHRRSHTAIEILDTIKNFLTFGRQFHNYYCGSAYEGSVTPDLSSDTDVIHCDSLIPVALDHLARTPGVSLIMVTDAWTYPGYVKLQWMLNGLSLTVADRISTLSATVDVVGRLCMLQDPFFNQDGPALQGVNSKGFHFIDSVLAFKCNTLPLFAINRLVTLRKRNHISGKQFYRFQRMGCFCVGAGYFISPEKTLEWRLSFSLQERHLMTKLNPTQHKVYILLKMIKKDIIEKILGCAVLTSYHCKTCILYAVEMTTVRSWTPENIISCLLQCVKLMILWLRNNYCPNYFNRNQNLFSKEGFTKFRKPLLHKLMELLQSNNCFLTLTQSDHVGQILLEGEQRWRNVSDMKKAKHTFDILWKTIRHVVCNLPVVILKLCGGQYNLSSLFSALNYLQQTDTINQHTTADTQIALDYLYPWFHLHIAKCLACLSYMHRDIAHSRRMLEAAYDHLRKAEYTDLVNVRLAKASILYKSGQYDMCYRLLQEVENDYTHKVIRVCRCTLLHSVLYRDEQDLRDRHRVMSGMSAQKLLKSFFAYCVVFLPSQFHIVPTPLKYEMSRSVGTQPGSRNEDDDHWFDWCVIDAIVYLYLMQYLVSTELQEEKHKQDAMCNIRAVIEEDNKQVLRQHELRQLGHRDTAYNILGWIYMQEQCYGDATQCFLISWKIRPFHNAAKFHMRDLEPVLRNVVRQFLS